MALKSTATDEEKATYQATKEAYQAYTAQKNRNTTVEQLLGSLINLGIVPGYENRKGPGGGIGKAGEKALREKGKAVAKTLVLESNFVSLALAVMNDRMPAGSTERLSRKAIVEEMGVRDGTVKPGSDVEALISAGIRQGEFAGFKTYRGPRGGVGRDDGAVSASSTDTTEETASSDDASETVEAVAPVAKKSKKSKK